MAKPRSKFQHTREIIALYDHIKAERAQSRCECHGECGRSHKFGIHRRCPNQHGRAGVHGTDKLVTLTVRHLNGDPKDFDEANLMAMCQTCVTRHRAKTKAAQAREAERRAIEAQHEPLFDIEPLMPKNTEVGAHLF